MTQFLQEVTEFLKDFQAVIYPFIISCYIIGSKVYRDLKNKRLQLDKEYQEKQFQKNKEKFEEWEHAESLDIIVRIKSTCNLFKDKSIADRVCYHQLENGTIATSKICNMFISCLAEDDRYGKLPKEIARLQRIPYSRISSWLEVFHFKDIYCTYANPQESGLQEINALYHVNVESHMSLPVYDYSHTLVGMCVFEYALPNYNNSDMDIQLQLLHDFRTAIESTLITYHDMREAKKQELFTQSQEV